MSKHVATNPGGRPPIDDADRLKTRTYRSKDAQDAKLAALGGPSWIRAQIDAADWPRGTKPRK